MPVGTPVVQVDINYKVAQLALTLRDNFTAIRNFKIWLDAQTDQMLTAFGYTGGDISLMRSGVGDMEQLRLIFEGSANLATAKDFRNFTKLMTGVS